MGEFLKAAAHCVLVAALLIALAACGGGGGGGGGSSGGSNTTVSGKITFDRVPIGSNGLNFNSVTQSPARQIVVEAIQSSSSAVLDSTTTDTSGNYTLTVPTNTSLFIRAKAQMTRSGSWNFSVKNNTNANALYVLDGSAFDSGSAGSTRNLNAASGWTGSAYTQTRAAAPFAILDTVFQAKELLLSAQSTLDFQTLDLYWSATNRASDDFCPATGLIVTSSFVQASSGELDDCSPAQQIASGIYVLGEISDTDEFDQHVIAHEFGHFAEARFSRSDSIGGRHDTFNDALDLRVAFGEGWGNAFSGMVLNNPEYRDSLNTNSLGSAFNLENNSTGIDGWYSEASVGQILWDLFDADIDAGDNVQVPFSSIYAAFAGEQKTTPALTSIFSFVDALITIEPGQTAAIDVLLDRENVNGTDEFGTGESNFNLDPTLFGTVYASVVPGATVSVCTSAKNGVYNKLNNRSFVRLDLRQVPGTYTITVQGAPDSRILLSQAARNPGVILWSQGPLASGSGGLTRNFAAGIYIIEVFDAQFASSSGTTSDIARCMNVSVN